MKITIVILLFISVAWARTSTKRVKDDPAKMLEGLVEDETVIADQSTKSDASDELAKLQDSDTLNGEMNDLSFGVEGDGSGENPTPTRKPRCRGRRCRKPTRKPRCRGRCPKPTLKPEHFSRFNFSFYQ